MGGDATASRRLTCITLDESQEGIDLTPSKLLGILPGQSSVELGNRGTFLPDGADDIKDVVVGPTPTARPKPSSHADRPW